jgi:signal transduction histidine kinase
VIGLLELSSKRPFAFGEADIATAQEAAGQLGVAMHNAQLIEKLAARRDRMRDLSSRLVRLQEDERRDLATELHDRIGQTLAGLNFTLAAVEQYCRESDAPVHEARTTVARLVQDVQDLSQSLRPPLLDDFGVVPALRWLAERVQQVDGLTLRVRQANVAGQRFAPDVETAVYRLVQESLTHLVRRPEVTEALVRMWSMPEMLYLDVEAVASAERSGDALFPDAVQGTLSQRVELLGGRLDVRPAPDGGWRVEAQLPLK